MILPDENLNLVDKEDNIIGKVLRSQTIGNNGIIYRSICIVIINSNNQILVTQRSSQKDNDPLFWDISITGHVKYGEEPKYAATRELFEESGLKGTLVFLTKQFRKNNHVAQFQYIYAYRYLIDREISLDSTEVESFTWLYLEELKHFLKDHLDEFRFIAQVYSLVDIIEDLIQSS